MKKVIITAAIILVAIICGIIVINMSADKGESSDFKVGMIMIGEKDDKNYNQAHYDGIVQTASKLGIELVVRENIPTDSRCMQVMEQLINDNCDVVICNSFEYGEYIDLVAKQHPEIYFYHAAGTGSGKNIASFFGRMYQMRYLCGIAAGLRTETNEIGYVASFDIP